MSKSPLSTFLLLATALIATPLMRAAETHLRIAVRSVVDRPNQGWGKAAIEEHGKIYYLMSIKEAKSTTPLVKPVDEAVLRKVIVDRLSERGFRAMTETETPDIILTVIYGRGWFSNPYIKGMVAETGGTPVVTLDGTQAAASITQARDPTYQGKLQNAKLEKLFIRITAWKYPDPAAGKKQKPKELWQTTVLINEPSNRDLNQFVSKMLAAASAYFDVPTKDVETITTTQFPEGFVHWGEAKVVPKETADQPDSQ